MSLNKSSVFLEVIEELSKNILLSEGDELAMAKEILYKSSHFLKINRANAWKMNNETNELICLIAYDKKKDVFYDEGILKAEDFPVYFNHINRSDIIISFDARSEPFNSELVEGYLLPNDVYSMMEVPIFSGGKMKGIICYEGTKEIRNWTNDEQHFAIALTQLLSLTMETKEKIEYRDELEKSIQEKSVLLSEINHRVKSNLAVITALIRSESNRAKDAYHKELLDNLLSKAFALSTLQNSIYQATDFQNVNFSSYLHSVIQSMNDSYGSGKNIKLDLHLKNITLENVKSIPCSLIINELLTNSFKHAFQKNESNVLFIELEQDKDKTIFHLKDNGHGLPKDYLKEGSGFDLINGLVDDLDGELQVESGPKGTNITLTF